MTKKTLAFDTETLEPASEVAEEHDEKLAGTLGVSVAALRAGTRGRGAA